MPETQLHLFLQRYQLVNRFYELYSIFGNLDLLFLKQLFVQKSSAAMVAYGYSFLKKKFCSSFLSPDWRHWHTFIHQQTGMWKLSRNLNHVIHFSSVVQLYLLVCCMRGCGVYQRKIIKLMTLKVFIVILRWNLLVGEG